MTVSTMERRPTAERIDVEAFIDPEKPLSWSRQMVALLRAGHYREGYEILAKKMPFVDSQMRPLAERLAGKQNYWTMTTAWIKRFLDTGQPLRILDVGCGVGCQAIEFAMEGHRTWGMDILPAMIERGNELIESLELGDRANLQVGDIRRLDSYYDASFFDAAIACDIFEHLDDKALLEVLHGLRRVMRPGGTLVVQTSPGLYYYWFEPDRKKLLAMLVPLVWLPDRGFTAYVRWLDRWYIRRLRREPVGFYRQEYGHINCMDPIHLRDLLQKAGWHNVRTFAIHAHRGFKDEGCLKARWTEWLFAHKSVACRNVFGIATVPDNGNASDE